MPPESDNLPVEKVLYTKITMPAFPDVFTYTSSIIEKEFDKDVLKLWADDFAMQALVALKAKLEKAQANGRPAPQ